MKRVRAALVGLVLLAAAPADALGQTLGPISASELEDWAQAMDRYKIGPRSCPGLVERVKGIIGAIVGAHAGSENSGWEWVNDLGRGVSGYTAISAHPVTGAVTPSYLFGPNPTQLSKAEIGSGSTGSLTDGFLWAVAHEALHWVTPVGVENGDIKNKHLGSVWQDLTTCFDPPF